jgi:hypothetical protein
VQQMVHDRIKEAGGAAGLELWYEMVEEAHWVYWFGAAAQGLSGRAQCSG